MTATNPGPVPLVTIVGETVALGPLSRDLIPLLAAWSNDLAARQNLTTPLPETIEERTARYERDVRAGDEVNFVIYARENWRPMGTTSLFHLDFRNGCADFGILIGVAELRHRGYGTEATRLLLDYAFTALGLRNVGLTVAEWNVAGQRAYLKAGFKEFGRRRACRWMGGRWWDDVHMDAVTSDFTSPVLAALLQSDLQR